MLLLRDFPVQCNCDAESFSEETVFYVGHRLLPSHWRALLRQDCHLSENPFGTKGAISRKMCLPLAEQHSAQFSELECEASLR